MFGCSINKGCAIPWFKLAPSRDNKKNEDQCSGPLVNEDERVWGFCLSVCRMKKKGGDGIGGEKREREDRVGMNKVYIRIYSCNE